MTRSWQGFTPNQVVRRLGHIGPLEYSFCTTIFEHFCSLLDQFLTVSECLYSLFIFEYSSFEYSYLASFRCLTTFWIYHLLWMFFSLISISSLMDVPFSQNPLEYLFSISWMTFSVFIWMISFWNDLIFAYLHFAILNF